MATIPKIVPKPVIYGFFLLGLLSSVAFRAIILLQKFSPGWVRPVWYFGVLGYMLFFIYRYYISQRRKRAIEHTHVIEKIRSGETLSTDDRDAALCPAEFRPQIAGRLELPRHLRALDCRHRAGLVAAGAVNYRHTPNASRCL